MPARGTAQPENGCLLTIVQLLLNNHSMETKTAATLFEALTSEARLSIFRLLVKYAPDGLVAGEIARLLDIPKTNLSFHLKTLVHSGLTSMEREGRNTRYRANIPLMLDIIGYLTAECCTGNPAQCHAYRSASGLDPRLLPPRADFYNGDTIMNPTLSSETADTQHPEGQRTDEQVRELVRANYAAIATGNHSCCCSGKRSGQNDPFRLAQSVGYDAKTLDRLPEGANMGLSCGNPVAIAALREGQVVLDLGCGGGFDVFQAGEQVREAGHVIGVDMTQEMIGKARKNLEQYEKFTGLHNVEFRLGEIEHLPVADASVDVVLSNCVINLSPDKAQVWREVFRVLKPGGKVSVSDQALLKPLPDNVRGMVAALVGCVAGAILVEETRALLEAAGFSKIILTPRSDYVRNMQNWNDPLYRQIAEALPEGRELSEYITSLSIEAWK